MERSIINYMKRHSEEIDWRQETTKRPWGMIKRSFNELPWDINALSCRPEVTLEFIESNWNESWNWLGIAMHSKDIMKIVDTYPFFPTNHCPHVAIKYIMKFKNAAFGWSVFLLLLTICIGYPYFMIGPCFLAIELVLIVGTRDWNGLISTNPNMTSKWIRKKMKDRSWSCFKLFNEEIGSHPSLPMDLVLKKPHKYPPAYLSPNPNLAEDVFNSISMGIWSMHPSIYWNKGLKIKTIMDRCKSEGGSVEMYMYFYLHKHPEFSLNMIDDVPYENWNWLGISSLKILNVEFLRRHRALINWPSASSNSSITMEDIENNPDLPWEYYFVGTNPNLTIEFAITHFEHLSVIDVAKHPNITYEMFKNLYSPLYNSGYLSWFQYNPNFTLDILINNYYEFHPAIKRLKLKSFSDIDKYETYIGKHSAKDVELDYDLDYAATVIQRWWIKIMYNPYHPVGEIFVRNKLAKYA